VAPADGGREMTLLSPIVSARGREPPPCDPPCRSLIRGVDEPASRALSIHERKHSPRNWRENS